MCRGVAFSPQDFDRRGGGGVTQEAEGRVQAGACPSRPTEPRRAEGRSGGVAYTSGSTPRVLLWALQLRGLRKAGALGLRSSIGCRR